jgi:hypothetical protein
MARVGVSLDEPVTVEDLARSSRHLRRRADPSISTLLAASRPLAMPAPLARTSAF